MKTEHVWFRKVSGLSLYLLVLALAGLLVYGCGESVQPGAGLSADRLAESLRAEATQIVREGLADDDPRVRANAIEVVASTRQAELMGEVRPLLRDEYVPVRFSAALAVGDTRYSLARSDVAQLLKDENESVRIAAAYAMDKLGAGGGMDLVRKAIESRDLSVRANAALLLGKSADRSAVKLLYRAMHDENSDDKVRLNAAEAIARLGDEEIFRKLWAMLISAYADDRVMGVAAMGALGTVQARDVLLTMLDDDVVEVRLAAAEQLGKFGDISGEEKVLEVFTGGLIKVQDSEGLERVNRWAALAIGEIGTERLAGYLPGLLKNESKFVRMAAAKAVFRCLLREHIGR